MRPGDSKAPARARLPPKPRTAPTTPAQVFLVVEGPPDPPALSCLQVPTGRSPSTFRCKVSSSSPAALGKCCSREGQRTPGAMRHFDMLRLFWGKNPKRSSESLKCSECVFIVRAFSGRTAQLTHRGRVLRVRAAPNPDPEVWGQSSCIWGRTACWQEGNAGYGLRWLISCANLARPWSPEIQLDTGMEVAVEGIF